MQVEFFNLYINCENKYIKHNYAFYCPYIKNKTTVKDVIEIFSTLISDENICQCFKYEIEQKNKIVPITNMNEKIYKFFELYSQEKIIKMKIFKKENCYCDDDYKKSKQEIIKKYKTKIKE